MFSALLLGKNYSPPYIKKRCWLSEVGLWASGFNMGFLDGFFFNSDSILCTFNGGMDPLLVSALNWY